MVVSFVPNADTPVVAVKYYSKNYALEALTANGVNK
jgi:hypothetical protein